MKLTIVFLAASATASAAVGATLKPDALVCESDTAVMHVLKSPKMAAAPGSEAISRSKAQLEFFKPSKEMDAAAATMRRIDPASQKRLEELEKEGRDGANEVVAKCASSGASAAQVTVLERRPITGVARISMTFGGSPATLFTPAASLSD